MFFIYVVSLIFDNIMFLKIFSKVLMTEKELEAISVAFEVSIACLVSVASICM